MHQINLTKLELSLNYLEEIVLSKNLSNPLLEHKFKSVKDNLDQIQPNRVKRWDALGRGWKWLAGSPDADDLRAINKSVNELISNNNHQTNINEQLTFTLNNLTNYSREKSANDEKNFREISNDLESLKIMLNLDIISDEIETLRDAIALSKLNVINSRLLSPGETKEIAQILEEQGIQQKLKNEALQFATTSVVTNGEIILYIIGIPNLSDAIFELLRVEAVINNGERIRIPGKRYFKGKTALYLLTAQCPKLSDWTICKTEEIKDVSSDECIHNVIKGMNSKCNYEIIEDHIPIIEMGAATILLNDVNGMLETTCGVADRMLEGSYLIVFENCSVSFDTYTHKNTILKIVEQPFFTPSTDLNITKIETYKPFNVKNVKRTNIRRLQHLQTTQSHLTLPLWSGISLTTCGFIIIIVYTILKTRQSNHTIQIGAPTREEIKLNHPPHHQQREAEPEKFDEKRIRIYHPPTLADTLARSRRLDV